MDRKAQLAMAIEAVKKMAEESEPPDSDAHRLWAILLPAVAEWEDSMDGRSSEDYLHAAVVAAATMVAQAFRTVAGDDPVVKNRVGPDVIENFGRVFQYVSMADDALFSSPTRSN